MLVSVSPLSLVSGHFFLFNFFFNPLVAQQTVVELPWIRDFSFSLFLISGSISVRSEEQVAGISVFLVWWPRTRPALENVPRVVLPTHVRLGEALRAPGSLGRGDRATTQPPV